MVPRLEPPICGPKIPEADMDNWVAYHDTHHFVENGDITSCLWCGTGFFTSLMISNGYFALAHKARAMMQMQEHMELVAMADKLEAMADGG